MEKKKVKKMDKKIAISQLERLVDEIPRLENLPPKNSEFPNWNNRVKDITKRTWGNNSREYNLYDGVLLLKMINFDNRQADMKQAYLDTLNQRKTALKLIIEEHKRSVIQKIISECKDFIATIIAKFFAEKTKGA